MRLFKWVLEYHRIQYIIDSRPPDASDFDIFMSSRRSPVIAIRLLMSSYWILDNVDTLRKLRVVRQDRGNLERNGKAFWLASLALHVWLDLRILLRCRSRRAYLQSQQALLPAESEHQAGLARKLVLLQQKAKFARMGVARCLADAVACLKELSTLR